MSVRCMTWVWDHSPVGGTERLVLLAIADCASDDGRDAWPSIATLARKTRVDTRTVQRVIRRLEDGGHLIVEAAKGGRKSNYYTVVMGEPDPRQTATPGNLPPRQDAGSPPAQCQGTPGTATPPERPLTVLEPSKRARARFRPQQQTQSRGAALPPPATAPNRCLRHPGQFADYCGPCRSEALGGAA